MTTVHPDAAVPLTPPRYSPLPGIPPVVAWSGGADGHLELLDQTRLPHAAEVLGCRTAQQVWDAIRRLCVRGAPAIGVAGAYGLCIATQPARGLDHAAFVAELTRQADYINSSRPTAVNLSWAMQRLCRVAASATGSGAAIWTRLWQEAIAIQREDEQLCRSIGEHGAPLVPQGGGVLTHCNAGALATCGLGTALAVLYVAHEQGRRFKVYADETRPLLQGARLTAYELAACGLDVTLLCDNAAASLMAAGRVQMVVVGADRIAANGDTANKIGTYGVALAAQRHGVPFYVAAPHSTFDLSLLDGGAIPIEQRSPDEVFEWQGQRGAPPGVAAYNPAFDVTPAALIRGIITDRGVLEPVTRQTIAEIF